jgi:hypothetical protein
MRSETHKFKRPVKFTGRNGYFTATGLQVSESNGTLYLSPITSKGNVGHCCIQIPAEDAEIVAAIIDGSSR